MSKIKLVRCPTITKREINNAVMDGRRFAKGTIPALDFSNIIHWDENFGDNPVRMGAKPWNWRGFCYLHELVEQQWYEDPDMIGKPVKVKDEKDDNWKFDQFISYSAECDSKFNCQNYSWYICEPVTAADLYQEQV